MKPSADWFFMAYFLPLAGCVAMGISSTHIVYKLFFLLGLFFLATKAWLTEYKKCEMVGIVFFIVLLGYVFYRTREKTLIITTLTIFGSKDVNIKKVLKYTLLIYIMGVTIRMGFSWLKIIPGEYHVLPKNGTNKFVFDFGFSHPNSAYNHILMICLMIVAVWHNKIKSYYFAIITVVMFLSYYLFLSRTGIFTYLILCIFLLMLNSVKNDKIKRKLALTYLLIPIGIISLSYLFLLVYPTNSLYLNKLNTLLSGRIELSYNAVNISKISWFGSINKSWLLLYYVDNAYVNLLLNYGILITIICILAYLVSAIYYLKRQEYYVLILFATMSIYAFMEYSPVNITWNPILLFITDGIFKGYSEQNNV